MDYATPPLTPPKKSFGSQLGNILFALATGGPSPGRYKEMVQERQQQQSHGIIQQAMAEAQARAAFPKAPEPTNTQRTYEYLKTIDPASADSYIKSISLGPPVAIDGVDEDGNQTRTLMPRSQAYAPQPARAPRRFDALPPGAVPMGGAPSQGGARFR